MSSSEHTTEEVGVGWPVVVGDILAQADAALSALGVEVGVGWGDQ